MELFPTASPGRDAPLDAEAVTLAVLLSAGVFGVVPATTVLLLRAGVGLTPAALGSLALVGGLYLAYAFATDRLLLGSLVATVALATVAANVPLSLGRYPGDVGQVMLVHAPLAATLGLLLARGAYRHVPRSRLELLLAGFVGWSVLAAAFGAGPRPDAALLFAAFVATVGLFASAVYRCVAAGVVRLRGLLAVFVTVVAGQSAFALAQLLNQRGFGLSVLGEVLRYSATNTLAVPLLGDPYIGVFVSGLTGGNGPLGQLLTVALPVTVVLAVSERSRLSYPLYALAILEAFLLRATGKDAGRAAVLLAGVALVGFVGLHRYLAGRDVRDALARHRDRLARYATLGASLVLVTLLPSAGTTAPAPSTSDRPVADGGGGGDAGAGGGGGDTGAEAGAGFDPSGVAIPFFDTGSLGIRFQQYVAGVEMAIRHPIFGIGGANYPYVAPAYGLPRLLGGNLFPLHSLFVAFAAETGIPGLLLYVGAVGVAARAGWRLLSTRDALLAAGVLAALVAWAAISFWTVAVRYTMVLPVWVVAAGAVGERRRAADRP